MKLEIISTKNNDLVKEILEQKPNLNYNQIKSLLRKKDIKLNGKKIGENCSIKSGDKIELFLPAKKQKTLECAYEDDNIKIVFKPQGMEVTSKDKAFLESETVEELTKLVAVHRLDKNTEGLVILAKNKIAEEKLKQAFANHEIEKKYLAICYAENVEKSKKMMAFLKKNSQKNFVEIFDKKVANSEQILTNYYLKEKFNNYCLLKIELITGKTHQIRAHLAHENIFVVGDEKYGKKEINKKCKTKKQLLCAYKLNFNFKDKFLSYLNNIVVEHQPTFSFEKFVESLGNVAN